MQRDRTAYLQDILEAGQAIQAFTKDMTFEQYQASDLVRAAVERKFSIIGEALNQALQIDPTLRGGIDRARDIVDFRNRVMHGYFSVDDRILWSATRTSLPALREEVEILLKAQSV